MKRLKTSSFTAPFLVFCSVLLLLIIGVTIYSTQTSAESVNQKTGTIFLSKRLLAERHAAQTDEKVKRIVDSPVFAEFNAWVSNHLNNSFSNREAHSQLGENLAFKRQQLMKELVTLDPQAALEKAVSPKTYSSLPSFVTQHLEKYINAKGDFLVIVVDEADDTSKQMNGHRTERFVVIGDTRYQAFVYGRKLGITTKFEIPLQGIVIDDVMAVDENPVRRIEPAEFSYFKVDSTKLNKSGVAGLAGGETIYFQSQTDFDAYVRDLTNWEDKIAPYRSDANGNAALSPWTEGNKTVLFIRADFPDDPTVPITQASAESIMNTQVNPFFTSNSYNKTSLQTTVTPVVVRLPQPKTHYQQGSNYLDLWTHARTAARTAGYETNNYNLDIVAFRSIGGGWAGRGYLGAKGTLLNGSYDLWVTGHELGHNYGLHHANFWRTTDGTTTGPGNSSEYADPFDMMGNTGNSVKHFGTGNKRRLDWLTDSNVQTVTTNGVYRIFAFDTVPQATRLHALKIRKDNTLNYWIEFRQLITNNANIMNGAVVRWGYNSSYSKTELLDSNPATSTASDAPLTVGQTINDTASRVKIRILGKGGTTPDSLDVEVRLNGGTVADFDGDGKTDVSVFRPAVGGWYSINSSNSQIRSLTFGTQGDLIVPGDYDADGKADAAVFRAGNWYILQSSNNAFRAIPFGAAGDKPVAGDYDGDGKTDAAVWRGGNWYILNSSNNQFRAVAWGASTDLPTQGDYDADGKTDTAVFRPSNGGWYVINSSNGQYAFAAFGTNGDKPVAADYDADGKTDFAVFRPSDGTWYLQQSTAGFRSVFFGASTDIPAQGDFDGDGKTDFAVYRPSNGSWYRLANANGSFTAVQFGVAGDVPAPSAQNP